MESALLTAREAAKLLNVSYSTILMMIHADELKAINISKGNRKTWRITKEAINNYIDGASY